MAEVADAANRGRPTQRTSERASSERQRREHRAVADPDSRLGDLREIQARARRIQARHSRLAPVLEEGEEELRLAGTGLSDDVVR